MKPSLLPRIAQSAGQAARHLRSSRMRIALICAPMVLSLGSVANGQDADRPEWEKNVVTGPGAVEPDKFHPNRDSDYKKSNTGRVTVHISSLPKNMNYMVENSAITRRMHREVHEYLLEWDWETWRHKPILAEDLPVVEDTVILKGGRGADSSNVLFGSVKEADGKVMITPVSSQNPLKETKTLNADEIEEVKYGTVFTFPLRKGVKWHDGHEFDSGDVIFSLGCFMNPSVDCDAVRFKYEKFVRTEALDAHTVRLFYSEQYFLTLDMFYDFAILPSHVFNLADSDNADHNPGATQEEQGTHVNENEANTKWIGLGPYKVTDWNEQWVDAERFEGYFDKERNGNVERIRWRHIKSDDAAKQALINGELDYWDRLRSEDYFGEFTAQKEFTENYYKGYVSHPYMGYTTWNMRRSKFSDPSVRLALAHCFDWDDWIQSVMIGLGSRITGSQYFFNDFYNRNVKAVPYDLDAAEELLLEAGWYDRDGDDIIDKDGQAMEIEFLMPTGNVASRMFGEKLQENFAKVGIKLNIATRDWAVFLERLYDRDYDCANLAWIQDLESDPEQIWHSKWADTPRSSNHCGMADEEVDRLIEAVQVEVNREKQIELMLALHERIYELQPYMFGLAQPKKIAVSKRLRNLKSYGPDPNYRIREWYLVDSSASSEQ